MARRGSRAMAFLFGMVVAAWLGNMTFLVPATGAAKGRARGVAPAAMNVNEQLAATGREGVSIGLIMNLKSATKQAVSSFDNFMTALKAAGLTDTLDGAGPYTIFAPDDNAFRMQGVGADDMTPDVLKMHIFEGSMMNTDFKNQELATMGGPVKMKKGREYVKLNGVAIKRPNVEVSNGVIHVMDGVIMP
mmetsp:Transcript_105416/g.209496  ORF Transcript_105416/g.209496 Transcript_105416/m.209496 type:complete len:190 (-) Transcript_105416:97-666(-)